MLGRLEMSVQQAIEQYDVVGDKVFGKPRFLHTHWDLMNYWQPKFDSKCTEQAIQEVIKNGITKEITQNEDKADAVLYNSHPCRCRT